MLFTGLFEEMSGKKLSRMLSCLNIFKKQQKDIIDQRNQDLRGCCDEVEV